MCRDDFRCSHKVFLNLLFIFVVVDWNQPSALQSLRTQTTGRRQMIKREALKNNIRFWFSKSKCLDDLIVQ